MVAMAAVVFAGRLWGNEGGFVAVVIFLLGIAAVTSYFRTRPGRPSD